MKKCKKCNIEKEECCFRFRIQKNWSGHIGICMDCEKEYSKQYYSNPKIKQIRNKYHKEYNAKSKVKEMRRLYDKKRSTKMKQYKKQYRSNPEVKAKEKERRRQYRSTQEFKEKRKEYRKKEREKLKNDPIFKIKKIVSGSILKSLKDNGGSKNGASCWKHLTYTKNELKQHLENLFEPWMTWENHGVYNYKTHDTNPTWQLDHIIPHSIFNYDSMDHPDFHKCWALENLRPLCAKQNIEDGVRKPSTICEDVPIMNDSLHDKKLK